MNVLHENVYTSKGFRGRGRRTIPAELTKNPLPKYRFEIGEPKNLVNFGPTNSNAIKTPVNRRRAPSSTSSSARKGSSSSNSATNRTPGSSSTNDDTNIILAITSGRGDARTEVGMAAIDVQYPYMILCQISDSQTYIDTLMKIYIFNPIEIIMPDTMCDDKNKLYSSIRKRFRGLPINPISRFHFNEKAGLERIQKHCCTAYSSVVVFVKQKYYALAATSALLKYVEYIQHIVYGSKSMKIEFQGSPHCAVIDFESAESLELVVSQGNDPKICLLGALDRCLTPMGRRSLRVSILQPPSCEEAILERQNCVSELVTNHSLRTVIQPVIRRLYGADRLLNMGVLHLHTNTVQNAERNLNYVLLLKNCLDVVPELRSALTTAESSYYEKVRKNLENREFETMKEKILKIIHQDARSVMGYTSANVQRCFAIKTGINDLLDVARRIYCELIEDMKNMVEDLGKRYNLPMSLACNATLGYHIQVDGSRCRQFKETDFSSDFIQIQKRRNSFTMTTLGLVAMSNQCKMSYDEIHIMSNVVLTNLLSDIKEHIGFLFQLSSDVAELDLIASLAQVSTMPGFVKPTFGSKLLLEDSIHPIMKIFNTIPNVTPNDVRASVPYNFHLITGPNMSGKSVYIKQVVLKQIMAQIGCYVLATKAEFRIADRILCRISFRDDIECQASTFTLEMKEAQYILQSVTPHSLIILDEPCRATAVEEGASIAIELCKKLFSTSAFIFCATHFTHLTKLADMYFNVTNHCFKVITEDIEGSDRPRIIYTHKLIIGEVLNNYYGIDLSRMSGLPEAIITKAYSVLENHNLKKRNPVDKGAGHQVEERVMALKRRYDFFAEIFLRHKEILDNPNLIKDIIKDLSIDVDKERAEGRNFQKRTVDYSKLTDPKSLKNDVPKIAAENGTAMKKICEMQWSDKATSKVEVLSGNRNQKNKTATISFNKSSPFIAATTSETRLSQEFGTEQVKRTIAEREYKLQKVRHVRDNISKGTFSETDFTPLKIPRFKSVKKEVYENTAKSNFISPSNACAVVASPSQKKNTETNRSYYNTKGIIRMDSNKTDNVSGAFKYETLTSFSGKPSIKKTKNSCSTEPRESSSTSTITVSSRLSTESISEDVDSIASSKKISSNTPEHPHHINLKSLMFDMGILPSRKLTEVEFKSSKSDFPEFEGNISQQSFSSDLLRYTSFSTSNMYEHKMEPRRPGLVRVNATTTASQNKNKEAEFTITSGNRDKNRSQTSSKIGSTRSLQSITESEHEDLALKNSLKDMLQQNVSQNMFEITPMTTNQQMLWDENKDNYRDTSLSDNSSPRSQELRRAMFNFDSQNPIKITPINPHNITWPKYFKSEFHDNREINSDRTSTTASINEIENLPKNNCTNLYEMSFNNSSQNRYDSTNKVSTQPRYRTNELFFKTDNESRGRRYRNSPAQCTLKRVKLEKTMQECQSPLSGVPYIVSSQYFAPSISKMTTVSDFSSQSESSQIARYTARAKEAEIFRLIEGEAFDEDHFFRNVDDSDEIYFDED